VTEPPASHASPASYEAVLAAVLGDPEADAPRHALAAFLRGPEPDRAVFIELQLARIARQRHMGSFDTEEVPADERRLLARHGAAWSSAIDGYARRPPSGGPACTFYRGLVARVALDPEVFIERGAELFAQAPIHHVDFAAMPAGVLDRLLATDALSELDSVGFAGLGLDDDAAVAIASCPRLARCLYLDLSLNPVGPRGFAAIAASPHLRQLLVVERAQVPDADPALTWHPGEVVVARISATGSIATLIPITPEGHAFEAAHGELAWLHRRNRISRFDARWAIEHGRRPARRP
jgi:hypothetical protein